MSDTTTNASDHDLLAQTKERLTAFFRQPLVKKSVNVLVPGVLAAVLFPIFGPIVAAVPAAISIQKGLQLLGISLSEETTKKLLKPLEGKQIDEADMIEVLDEALHTDKRVNEEAAKALVTVVSTVKEAALSNPKLDAPWLAQSMETSLKQQGETMAQIASQMHTLLLKDGDDLTTAVQQLLHTMTWISVSVTADQKSEVSGVKSTAKASGGAIGHQVTATNESKITDVQIDSQIT